MINIDALANDPAVWLVSNVEVGKYAQGVPPFAHRAWWNDTRIRGTLAYALQGYRVKSRSKPHGIEG